MSCKEVEVMLSAAIDGELEPDQQRLVDEHLAACAACRQLHDELTQVAQQLDRLPPPKTPDELFDDYERSVFSRLERGSGWILLSLGAMLLLGFGSFLLVRDFLLSSQVPLLLRLGVALLLAGFVVLTVSTARRWFFTRKHDKYKGVER